VSVRASDGNGGIDTQNFSITVTGGNASPTIDSAPVTTATVGQAYSYDVNASDGDGDTLTYSLDVQPLGMSINASSGLISWTPSAGQEGSRGVTVRVSDGNGGIDTQSFSINVASAPPPPNTAPTISSSPVLTGTEGQAYTYDVEATDADGDTLTYSLVVGTTGMTISASTGLIEWTPAANQTGSSYVAVRVEDGNGGTANQDFWIAVEAAQTTPTVHIGDLDAVVTNAGKNWSVAVTITVHDQNHQPAPDGLTVQGNWSGSMFAAGSCVLSGGSCTVDTGNIAKSDGSSVQFTLSNIVGDVVFQSGVSHDPDGDSNGLWITATR
jgi:hypothetical protein